MLYWYSSKNSESFSNCGRKKRVKKSKIVLKIIYAPWCIWSKRLVGNTFVKDYKDNYNGSGSEGEYLKIKKFTDKHHIKFDVIDGEKNKGMAIKLGVRGFPGSVIMKNGEVVKSIPGYILANDMIKFLKEQMHHKEDKHHKKHKHHKENKHHKKQDNKNAIFAFYASWCPASRKFMGDHIAKGKIGNEWKKIDTWCNKNNVSCIPVDVEKNSQLAKQYDVEYLPTIIMKKGEKIGKIVGSNSSGAVIKKYLNLDKSTDSESPKSETESPKSETESSEKVGKTKVMIFFTPWCGWSRKMVGKKIVPSFQGHVNSEEGIVNAIKKWCGGKNIDLKVIDSEKNSKLAKKEGVTGFPHTIIKVNGKKIGDIGGYMPKSDFVGELERILASHKKRKNRPKEKGLVMKTLYAPWCIWSKRLVGNTFVKDYTGSFRGSGPKGEFTKVNSFAKKNNIKYDVIDGEKNTSLAKELGLNGWPGTVIMKDGEKVETIYGFRPASDMIKMLKKHM
jgi:thiol-disulfide isomerase/thioredoxin